MPRMRMIERERERERENGKGASKKLKKIIIQSTGRGFDKILQYIYNDREDAC